MGCAGVVLAWSSGAYDINSNQFLGAAPIASYDSSAVYDPASKTVFFRTAGFIQHDIVSGNWSSVGNFDFGFPPLWPRYSGGNVTGTLDGKRHIIWMAGYKMYWIWDITRGKFVTDDWVTTGGGEFTNADQVKNYPDQQITTGGGDVINAVAPGLAYDEKADSIVGAPMAHLNHGTFGRWRYIPKYNVFILVNDGDAVYFYKNTAGGGT